MAHPTRYAIQKARKSGWTTLEVGEDRPQAEARFALMVNVNPRAYFRLIQLDHTPGMAEAELEFNWKLLQLHDPNQSGPAPASPRRSSRPHRPARTAVAPAGDRVRAPVRIYLALLVAGILAGALVYLRYGLRGG